MGFFPRTQERVQDSRGKRVISVQATEVLLYLDPSRKTDRDLWDCLGKVKLVSQQNFIRLI